MKLCEDCKKEFEHYIREFELDLQAHFSFTDKQFNRIIQLLKKHFKVINKGE